MFKTKHIFIITAATVICLYTNIGFAQNVNQNACDSFSDIQKKITCEMTVKNSQAAQNTFLNKNRLEPPPVTQESLPQPNDQQAAPENAPQQLNISPPKNRWDMLKTTPRQIVMPSPQQSSPSQQPLLQQKPIQLPQSTKAMQQTNKETIPAEQQQISSPTPNPAEQEQTSQATPDSSDQSALQNSLQQAQQPKHRNIYK